MTHVHHIGLAIDQATNDLYLEADGNLAMARDALAVGQHVRQRIKTFQGEWFLDLDAGVPWLSQIMGKRYEPELAEAIVKAEILNTDGVTAISGFSISFDMDPRRLRIRGIDIETVYEEEVRI